MLARTLILTALALATGLLVWFLGSTSPVAPAVLASDPQATSGSVAEPSRVPGPLESKDSTRNLALAESAKWEDKEQVAPSQQLAPAPRSEYPTFWTRNRRLGWAQGAKATTNDSIDELIDDLQHDSVSHNACYAAAELGSRLAASGQRDEIRRKLDIVLLAEDRQQRRIALGLLQSFSQLPTDDGRPYAPSERLLDAAIAHFESWSPDYSFDLIPYECSNEKAVAFALEFAERLHFRLVDTLDADASTHAQLLAAYVLARTKHTARLSILAPILIGHLQDNWIGNDALMAVEGLYALGPATRPWLLDALPSGDAQMRQAIELLLLEFADPATTAEQQGARGQLTALTWKCEDPVQSWTYLPDEDYLSGYTNGL